MVLNLPAPKKNTLPGGKDDADGEARQGPFRSTAHVRTYNYFTSGLMVDELSATDCETVPPSSHFLDYET